jgi:hypothetical protein
LSPKSDMPLNLYMYLLKCGNAILDDQDSIGQQVLDY